MSGTPIAYNATYFFEQVGLDSSVIYNLNIGGTVLALFGAVCSWLFLMPRFGRRTIYVCGTFTMGTLLYIIGLLNIWSDKSRRVGLSQSILAPVWKFCFQLSAGQLGWAIPAEVGSTRLRQKTIVLARNAYYITLVIANVFQPYMINPTAWGLSGYTGKHKDFHSAASEGQRDRELTTDTRFCLGHHSLLYLHLGILQASRDQRSYF
jgi:SP family general alpha glucoside:H+ symporter-like MFS transporter